MEDLRGQEGTEQQPQPMQEQLPEDTEEQLLEATARQQEEVTEELEPQLWATLHLELTRRPPSHRGTQDQEAPPRVTWGAD